MSTLHDQDLISKRNVHYRRATETATVAPSTRANKPLDVTARQCVPCAIVGHNRAADVVNEVGTPECHPHHEFSILEHTRQREIVRAWSSDGAAVGIIAMVAAYREQDPEWFDRCRPTVAESVA